MGSGMYPVYGQREREWEHFPLHLEDRHKCGSGSLSCFEVVSAAARDGKIDVSRTAAWPLVEKKSY